MVEHSREWITGVAFVIQSLKPHLPINPRHMKTSKFWGLGGIGWFISKGDWSPGFTIQTSFDNDFRSGGGHYPKQSIGIEGTRGADKVRVFVIPLRIDFQNWIELIALYIPSEVTITGNSKEKPSKAKETSLDQS